MRATADPALDEAARPLLAAAYDELLDALRHAGPAAVAARVRARAAGAGLALADRALPVDPVPRLVPRSEWEGLAELLVVRAEALEARLRAAYADGAVPDDHYTEAGLPAPPWWLGIVGFDVVRDEEDGLVVLEDNVLTPGHAAVPAARELLDPGLDAGVVPLDVREAWVAALAEMLGAGPAAVLADGPGFETGWLAAALGVPVVGVQDDLAPFAVVWQRTAEDRTARDDGTPTALGRALRPRVEAGTLQVVNALGCGVAGDKALTGTLPGSPRQVLLADGRDEVLEDPAAWVLKPRHGAGGRGVVVAPDAAAVLAAPADHVAQRRVAVSTVPVVEGDGLVDRPADLRAFAIRTRAGFVVPPAAVSRYAPGPGQRTNTSIGGGVKDVWVVDG